MEAALGVGGSVAVVVVEAAAVVVRGAAPVVGGAMLASDGVFDDALLLYFGRCFPDRRKRNSAVAVHRLVFVETP